MENIKNIFKNQTGQALLIIVLVMVVGLTITLAVVSRSIVNLKTSVEQTDSQKALAAAEAGIEQSIKNNASIGSDAAFVSIGNGASYKTSITQIVGSSSFLVNGGNILTKNEGAYVWLSDYNNTGSWVPGWNGTLTIYFGNPDVSDTNNPALEVVLVSGNSVVNAQIKRYAFDPNGTRADTNNFYKFGAPTVEDSTADFVNGNYTVQAQRFSYRVVLRGITGGMVIRLNPIYESSFVAAEGSSPPTLPRQGQTITAEAKSGSVRRKVTVFQGYPELPAELFPYSILVPK